MTASETIFLKADPNRGGDLGNYWHYLFGFFVPATFWLWKNPTLWQGKLIKVDSCNPLTDALMKEYLDHLQVPFEFEEMTEKTVQMTRKDWKSIRGKIWRRLANLERKFKGEKSSWFTYHLLRFRGNTLTIPRWDKYLEQFGDFPLVFKSKMNPYRSYILAEAKKAEEFPKEKNRWLIIKRATPPDLVKSEEGKKARWFPGYGSERRELKGIEEGIIELQNLGYTATSLATGDLGFFRQISVFNTCKVLIGVRGAELANMFWMDQNSEVILYMSASFQNEPIQRKLAFACQLKYHEIPHEGAISPQLNVRKILQLEKL